MENSKLKDLIKEEIKTILSEQEPAIKGAANLKPLIEKLPGVDVATFMMAYNMIKAGKSLNLNQTKAMANAMIGLIKSPDDQLLNKIVAQLKNIEG
jgi:hypothetical protein